MVDLCQQSDCRVLHGALVRLEPYAGKLACTVVCPAKAGMFSRSQSFRGKSQKPRSWDSRVVGNQNSEAYRQSVSLGGVRVNRAVMKMNVDVASKVSRSEGRARNRRAKAAWGSRNLTDTAIALRRGGNDGTMARAY